MRIRRLELAGIGPFAAAYTIDFDALTAGGLFLLDGPTGSGKSTIIDAITWGLYGAVAGGRDSTDDRMRSTHAAPAAQSYVDLVFSVEAGTFRVRRTPQWTKPGNKNPTNATGKLWRLSEGAVESGRLEAGEVLETKAAGTSIEVARLIGLNREQFVQTIVLPQGKFADFLRLRSSERTALLEQIFDTGIYRRVAEELYPGIELLDMGDFAGAVLKYLRKHPLPRLAIVGGVAKLSKLAAGYLDLHSHRTRIQPGHLRQLVEGAGASPELADAIGEVATVAHAVTLAGEAGIDLPQLIADSARDEALAVLGGAPVEVEIVVIDRAGKILARAH